MIEQYIKIKTDFEATHNWPECKIHDVSFLKYEHRHKIYVTVQTETTTDRQIEFFIFKMAVDKIIQKLYGEVLLKHLGSRSMEQIGTEILRELKIDFPTQRYYKIEVSEDNQVSGIIVWNSEEE